MKEPTELESFIFKARAEGKKAPQIAEEANALGYKTSKNRKLDAVSVYGYLSRGIKEGHISKHPSVLKIEKGKVSSSKPMKKLKPSMITIPLIEEPSKTGKVMTMITDIETTERILAQFLRGAA